MNIQTINRALAQVQRELSQFGLYTRKVESTDVFLHPFLPLCPAVEGLCWPAKGQVWIPRWNLPGLFGRTRCTVREVLRHEFGHVLFARHRREFQKLGFSKRFRASNQCGRCHDCRITAYARTDAEEDFCETFAEFLKLRGRTPRNSCRVLRDKWRFIQELSRAMRELR